MKYLLELLIWNKQLKLEMLQLNFCCCIDERDAKDLVKMEERDDKNRNKDKMKGRKDNINNNSHNTSKTFFKSANYFKNC